MAICSVTPKVFLSVLTIIFWTCAAGLLYVGISVYKEFNEYEAISQYMYTLLPATIIMAIAAFLFLIGLVGCVGAFKEQRCLLGLYFSILLVILLTTATCSVLAYVYRHQVETGLRRGLDEALANYGNPNASIWTQEIDFMQQEMKCCGINGSADWQKTPWGQTHTGVPDSCCPDNNCTAPATPYTHGCYSFARQQFMNHLGLVAVVASAFGIILLIGMVCSCILACHRRVQPPYMGLTSPDHLAV